MAAVTFATGAYAAWGSTFYQRIHGLTAAEAGQRIGLLLVGAGLIGIVLGMFVPDLLRKFTKRAYLLLAAMAVVCATPLGIFGILDHKTSSSLAYLFGASVLLSMVLGPCNTVTANVVAPNRRAAAYAAFIFFIHLLGDISSPILLGWISGLFGEPDVMASAVGRLFASIGAVPVGDTNLTVAMLSVAPILMLGFLFFAFGSVFLPADEDKVRGAGGVADRRPGAVPPLTCLRSALQCRKQRQCDLKRDQQDDRDLECFHALTAGLLNEEVVHVADGLELAADVLLPVAKVEPRAGDLEDAGEVMVADQFQRVVNPLEQAGGLDLEFADLADRVAVKAPAKREACRRLRSGRMSR